MASIGAAKPAAAEGVAQFYQGRTVNVIIGYGVGGGYDTYARLLARSIGKHIPGNPNIVPQNMPGAGSLKALLYLSRLLRKTAPSSGPLRAVSPLCPCCLEKRRSMPPS